PGLVRVVPVHLFEFLQSLRPEVLLVNHAVMTHDERSDSSHVMLRRCGHQGETADHDTLHHEVHLAERRSLTLPLEDFEDVAVVALGTAVALFNRSCKVGSHRTSPGTIGVLPSQAVLPTWSADDALRVLVYVIHSTELNGIFVLCFHVATAN